VQTVAVAATVCLKGAGGGGTGPSGGTRNGELQVAAAAVCSDRLLVNGVAVAGIDAKQVGSSRATGRVKTYALKNRQSQQLNTHRGGAQNARTRAAGGTVPDTRSYIFYWD
jgi:hypothetical protein